MSFLDYFTRSKSTTASIAKERLQIIVAHERTKAAIFAAKKIFPQMKSDNLHFLSPNFIFFCFSCENFNVFLISKCIQKHF